MVSRIGVGIVGAGQIAAGPAPLIPEGLCAPVDNVAALYLQFAKVPAGDKSLIPNFDAALRRHRLLNAIERANETGQRQPVAPNGSVSADER
jgi:predicted dehydrogenase